MSEIIYFESNSKKILIHMTGNKMIEFYGKLDDVEQYVLNELNCECFVRKHKSFFINNNHIYRSTKRSMTLLNGQTLPISRTYQNTSL